MLAQRAGRSTVPQMFIGETHVGGCDDLHALDARASSTASGQTGAAPDDRSPPPSSRCVRASTRPQHPGDGGLAREAAAKGATYLQTPEMTGASARPAGAARHVRPRGATPCGRGRPAGAGARRQVPPRLDCRSADDGKVANRGFLFGPTATASRATTRSTCSTSISTTARAGAKSATYEPGERPWWRICRAAGSALPICYDVRFPAAVPGLGAGRRARF